MTCEKPLRTVLLRHDLPDGSHHFDWMIAQDPAGSLPLRTWRLVQRLDELRPGEAAHAVRLSEHRPVYLDFQGDIAGARGSVSRLAQGLLISSESDSNGEGRPDSLCIQWQIAGKFLTQTLSLARLKGENWLVTCTA